MKTIFRTRTFLAKLLLVASLSIGSSLGFAPSALADPQVPKEYQDLVLTDQMNNIPAKHLAPLTPHERRVQPAYHWDIPEEQAQTFVSKYLDPETEKLVRIEKNGKKYVRFFMVNDDHTDFKGMVQAFGEPQQEYWATRMQSKATYFLWNPSSPETEPFFVKMQRSWPSEQAPFANQALVAENAVKTSDLAEDILRSSRYDGSAGSIFPERFGAGLKKGDFTYANSLRKVRPLVLGDNIVRGKLYPAHGVIGSKLASVFADRAGITDAEWMEHYLETFAKHLATMNLKEGLYLEEHTQNLVLEVDEKTGKILRMHSRDLSDVMIDPTGIRMNKIPVALNSKKLPINILNEFWIDVAAKDGHEAGRFFAYYAQQAVSSFVPTLSERGRLLAKFFHAYVRESEKILGTPIPLSDKAKELLSTLEAKPFDANKVKKLLEGTRDDLPTDRRIGQFLMQEITDTTAQIRVKKFVSELPILPKLQKKLAAAYQAQGIRHNHPLPEKLSPQEVNYGWDGEGVWAIDRESGKLVGYGYALPDTTKADLNKLADQLRNATPGSNSSSFVCKVRALFGLLGR